MGVSIAVLGAIERGTRKADSQMIHLIAETLGVDPDELTAVKPDDSRKE